MNCEYAEAIGSEREAWLALQLAGITAVKLQIEAISMDRCPAQDAVRWIANLAAAREGIARRRWHAASDRLAEASARFVAEANRHGEPEPM